MLVVLAIVGVMAGAVVMGIGQGDARGPEAEARRLAARLELAGDEAMVTGRTIGFVWDKASYRFVDWQAGRWQDDSAPALEPHALPPGLSLAGDGVGTVVVGADGGGTPLALRIAPAGGGGWSVAFDGVEAQATPAA